MEEKKAVQKQLLGEILIERQLITSEQLAQALEVQQQEKGYIGEILVKLGLIEELDVVTALVVQCNFPYIAISKYEIDKSIVELIPKDFAKKNLVMPLDRVGEILSVVMNNPLDIAVRAEIQRLTNYKVAPFIATRLEIEKAVTHWYGEEN